jgi:CRP/FNR family transcriptional regulator, cyclic AMP receptor protein
MDKATLVRHMPLFESLDDDEVTALVGRLEERPFDAGVVIFREKDAGDTMFLVQDGAVEIATGEGKQKTTLAQLFAGQFFGELSLFDGSPRSATAVATKASVLYALERDDFLAFLKSKPEAATKILAEMAERMRQTNALFSQQVSRDVLEEAEERLTMGQRVADAVASFGGSWTFIFVFGLTMAVWMSVNAWIGEQDAFDPFPFILLNLALSTCAALQAPVIMMSQNRQATKDKLLAQNDYLVNLKAELGIQQILKNQGEMQARLQLLERQTTVRTAGAPTTPPEPRS